MRSEVDSYPFVPDIVWRALKVLFEVGHHRWLGTQVTLRDHLDPALRLILQLVLQVGRWVFVKGASAANSTYLHRLIDLEWTCHRCRQYAIVPFSFIAVLPQIAELDTTCAALLPCRSQVLNASNFVQELDQAALRVVFLLEDCEAAQLISLVAPISVLVLFARRVSVVSLSDLSLLLVESLSRCDCSRVLSGQDVA